MAERVAFARVSDAPITVEECVAAVGDAAAGAVVTFAGIVRDHDGGRGVVSLGYEAHPSAGEAIASVAELVAGEFPTVTIAVEHRVGRLGIGDLALACAVSSAHRAEAFAACARLVDVVKESVPIWKEQHFTDGGSEWVASLG
jgi:molybdopterin synthase catalytic subunit